MQRDQQAYLWDVLEAINAIETFTAGMQLRDFLASELVQSAVERKLEIVGEALRQAETSFAGTIAALPDAQSAISLRNRLAHGYLTVNYEIIWQIVKTDLQELKTSVAAFLQSLPEIEP